MGLPVKREAPKQVFQAPSSTEEVWDAGWEEGFENSFVMSWARKQKVKEFNQQGPVLSPEEINKKHGIEVRGRMTELAAFHITSQKEERERRQDILIKAPDTFLGNTAKFMSGVAGAMTDPIDFAIGAAFGGLTAPVLKFAKAGSAARYMTAVVENAAAVSLTEIAAVQASGVEGGEYTAQQALQNIVAGSFIMTTAVHGTGAAIRKITGMGDMHMAATFHNAEAAIEMGKSPAAILDLQLKGLQKDMEITPVIRNSVDDVFGDNAGKILAEGDDLKGMYDKIRAGVDSGDVSGDDAIKLMDSMANAGVEERLLNYADPNAYAKYSDEVVSDIKKKLESARSDYAYSLAAEKLRKNTDLSYDDVKVMKEKNAEAEVLFADMKKRATAEDGDLVAHVKEIEKFEKQLGDADVELKAYDDIVKCFGVAE